MEHVSFYGNPCFHVITGWLPQISRMEEHIMKQRRIDHWCVTGLSPEELDLVAENQAPVVG